MNRIIFPLTPHMRGPEVADLQDALQLCLDRHVVLSDDEAGRRELSEAVSRERAEQVYGGATRKLLSMVQEGRRLQPSGEVDEPTAGALNGLLREWGLLEQTPAPRFHIVTGAVRREDGLPLQGVRVRAAHEAERGAIRLGEDTTDAEGRYTIRYELLAGVNAINLRVSAIGRDGIPPQSSEVVRNAGSLESIDLTAPIAGRPDVQARIEGRIVLEHGLPAEHLKLRLYRRDFGGKATLLNETSTLAGGRYAFTYDPGDRALSLEVRAVRGVDEEVPLSKPLNDLARKSRAELNLVAPGNLQPLAAEYRRLSADLAPHVGEMAKLAEARENAERQDLTVLNRATGWDARLIALAATAERLGADPDVSLRREAMYGLLRAGLPSDKLLLAQVDPEVAEQALKTVRHAGIVELTDQEIAQLKAEFAGFASRVRLTVPVPGSRSTYGDLLKASGLSGDAQAKFASVYFSRHGDGSRLWEKAREAGLDDTQVRRLQLQGKLAFLAGNSDGMTARLMQKPIDDPAQLVAQDYHQPTAWLREMFDQAEIPEDRRNNLTEADTQKLVGLIPATYAAEKVEDRLNTYAEDMARKVRLSYPTQVVGRMIEKDDLKLPEARDATVKLLKSAAGQGFRLGQSPVAAFIKTHAGVTADMPEGEVRAAEQQLRTLQRVYQITPGNEAMSVLMGLGITSAYDAMAYTETAFVHLYNAKYLELHGRIATPGEPRLIYRKATQVSSVTYNLFTIASKLGSEPQVAGMSAPVEVRESVRSELIKQFPTMESLFGSLDFCECEHCRTVLSPAAYLVDLLQFVDPEPGEWANFLAGWKATHGDQEYPHIDNQGKAMKPADVLIERRPDIPHLLLTCENTHTALPYIDIVNEILEYYVANGKLEDQAALDTGEASTAELLAEPQHVIREAYDKLRDARYPLNLPFDLWLETVRQFCNHFDTPLARVLEVFRRSDDLFAPAEAFDRSAIFIESVGVSPAEAAIFTDPDPLGNDRWNELYGLPTARPVIQNPTNAGHATLTVANAEAARLRAGLACTYFDVSAGASSAESKTISSIGGPDSGAAGQSIVTFAGVWTAPPDAGDLLVGDAAAMLRSAKTLSRYLGVTYKEIAEIVLTGVVNPKVATLSGLYKLGVSVRDARFYLDHKGLLAQDPTTLSPEDQKRRLEVDAFSQELGKLAATFTVPLAQLEAELQAIPFDDVLVLADPDAGCDFDLTTLRYASGDPADAIAFLRINLFVRLWRKLGWTIEETDRALQSLVPKNTPFDAAHLAGQPLKTALIYLAHLKKLDEKVRVGKQSRLKLITLWSDIATTGNKPLYAQLFLTPGMLKSAPVFDHPLGRYLSAAGVKLKDHLLAVQGALGLSGDEISHILVDVRQSLDAAELSLPNVSQLYRYGLLAKGLKLPVRELIALKQLSGLDPFMQLHPEPLADAPAGAVPPKKAIDFDHPFTQTLRFVEAVEEVRESGLKVEDLEYLLRHRFDQTGDYRPNVDGTLALLRTLAEGVRAIRAEHAAPADPGALSEEVLRQKLGLALPPDVVERFLAMRNGTVEFTATRSGVPANDQLQPETFAEESAIREVRYNAARQEQKLTFSGVLLDAAKDDLKARLPSPLLGELLDDVQQQARSFFDRHLLEQPPAARPAAGFLDAADFDLLFAPSPPGLDEAQQQERVRRQRSKLAQAFLPFLQQRLIRQFIVQTMTAHTGADSVLVESFLTDDRLLGDPTPLLDAFSAAGGRGVTATFFASADGTGAALASLPIPDANTGLKDKDGNPLRPAAAISARLEGYLEVPAPGAYRFYIALDKQNAAAELRFDHLPRSLLVTGVAATDNDELGDQPGEFLELKPGNLYAFALTLQNLNGGEARLLVQGETVPKGPISQLTLYPSGAISGAERAVTLLTKALRLVHGVGLSEREIRYLLTHATAFGGLSLSELPTRPDGDTPAERAAAAERFARFLRLAAYARLKRDLAAGTDDLIGIFEANESTAADNLEKKVYPLIARLTRRDEAGVKATAEALFAAPDFASEQPLQRLWEALQVVERFGVPLGSLLGWTRIVSIAAAPQQRFEIARDLKEAIKARFDREAWQRVAQPIFDQLRRRQRDALVPHVMHRHGFARMEQLYEYFLIDPGMEPVVQTSRIRLAIASLQLFIQRCLLNLEPQVHPSVITAGQWEWMKRYRVWEANRKIFLFPENWLEPEFRDDKTHLFAEVEGALLQGDVSSDLVEDAFLNYLKKLDELARLDVVGMHLEDDANPARRTLHVIGRTYSRPHKYFYRRYAHQMWTPWEPVSAEIEGDHLAPVVWRGRLYLFWVTFMDQPAPNSSPNFATGSKKLTEVTLLEVVSDLKTTVATKRVDVQLHWSEYLRGEWTTRESGGLPSGISTTVNNPFDPRSVFVHVSKAKDEHGEDRGVYVHLGGVVAGAFHLAGRNSAPEAGAYSSKPGTPYSSAHTERANRYSGNGGLIVSFQERITTEPGKTPPKANLAILNDGGAHTLLPCDNDLTALGIPEDAYQDAANPAEVEAAISRGRGEIASLMKPVFYQDNTHTLFVEPNVIERTIEQWQDWVTPAPQSEPGWQIPDRWKDIYVVSELPLGPPIPDLLGPVSGFPIDSGALINPKPDYDWLVNPATALAFDGVLIGPTGRPGLEILPGGGVADGGGSLVNVNPGSGLGPGSTVVLARATTLEGSGLTQAGGGLNVIGSAGFNTALEKNFTELNRSRFGAAVPGAGLNGR